MGGIRVFQRTNDTNSERQLASDAGKFPSSLPFESGAAGHKPQLGKSIMARGKSSQSLELIDAAYEILEEIQPASVRAVCYKLFNRGLIAEVIG